MDCDLESANLNSEKVPANQGATEVAIGSQWEKFLEMF